MKTCQSCKWCKFYKSVPYYSRCTAPQSYTTCFVTGGLGKQEFSYCSHLRGDRIGDYNTCTPEGLWWEEKEVVQPLSKTSKFIAWLKRS